jgi:translation initiation factor 1 (eIF-1/SUI1)
MNNQLNPFEPIEQPNQDTIKQSHIEIWVETCGRKKNTYVSGWNISEDLLKCHIKVIKKKNGCNGTLKSVDHLDNVIQLQGDHSDYMLDYLKSNGIDNKMIHVKG